MRWRTGTRRAGLRGSGRRLAGLLLVMLIGGVAGCDAAGPVASAAVRASASVNPNAGAIRVAAATSLADAFNAMKGPFEAANPGMHVVFTFGAAPTLAGQVRVGGFDVFAADDLKIAQTVVTDRRAAGPAQAFAGDRIVLVVPAANPAKVSGARDLARPGVRIAAAAPDAPLSAAVAQVVAQLAPLAGYPADFTAAIASNSRVTQDDARAVLARVENGDADAAFVYASDAQATARVTVVALPDGARVIARFGVVVIATAVDPVAAAAFARWLTTTGQKILADHGFEPPGTT